MNPRLLCIPLALLACVVARPTLGATLLPDSPRHFIFVNRDREHIHDAAFLATPAISGAEIKYTWRELEPTRDQYAFGHVLEDLAFLEAHGKRLVLQLQDVSYDARLNVPDYLVQDSSFHGGAARKFEAQGNSDTLARFDGWVARRWDPAVQERFARLLHALGDQVGGRIEALVLPETAVEFGGGERNRPTGFTPESYVTGVKSQMRAARAGFPARRVLQYANFMPGEWLPMTDRGYLRSIYVFADSLGLGVGGPDLMPHRKQLNTHSYPLIAARRRAVVPAGVAVQQGNLAARDPVTGKPVTVPELVAFARDSLRLDYIFWGMQEPYYTRDVLPWLRSLTAAAASSKRAK